MIPFRVLPLAALAALLASPAPPAAAQSDTVRRAPRDTSAGRPPDRSEMFERQRLYKRLTDLSLYVQLSGEMIVRKVRYPGENDFLVPAYVFAPRDTTRRRPVIVIVHGGVHGDFDDQYVPHIRSLVREGWVVVAPEYRGSTGYGAAHYDAIDYGGKEVEDCVRAREFIAGHAPAWADTSRTAMLGWSHGGFIALHAVLRYPAKFRAAAAHVPVADLPSRIRSHSESYHRIFAAQPGFGGRLEQNFAKYWERSPIAHARRLRIPVLVHAASNDDDVFIAENRNLRDSMVAAGMDRNGMYQYREWQDPPGGHSFSRIDSPQARESWRETLAFLRRHLQR